MKRILLIFIICFMGLGFGNYNLNKKTSQNKNYVKIELGSAVLNVPYIKPLDFKQYEVYVSLTTSFNPTGYSGTEWAGEPNVTADWDGVTNNLFIISQTDPIQVVGLIPGVEYYVKVVAVDKSNQRSIPSIEYTAIAGDAQRSTSYVIVPSDASARDKAGADYVCTGTADEEMLNAVVGLLSSGGTITFAKGTFYCSDSFELTDNITINGQGATFNYTGSGTGVKIITNSDPTSGNAGIKISNLSVTNAAGCYGIYLQNVSNVNISEITSNYNARGIELYEVSDAQISNCTTNYNTYVGTLLVYCTNCSVLSSCRAFYNGNGSGNGIGIWMQGGTNCKILDSYAESNESFGILVSLGVCINIVINGNHAIGNSTLTNNSVDNIAFSAYSGSSDNVIQNNICRIDSSQSNNARYGINVGAVQTLITGNDCYNSGISAGIYDTGTSTNFGSGNRINNGTWSTSAG